MKSSLKTIAAGAITLTISAGSAFSQESETTLPFLVMPMTPAPSENVIAVRRNIDGSLGSASVCAIDNGIVQKFYEVNSLRQCFDYTAITAENSPEALVEGTAYSDNQIAIKDFVCEAQTAENRIARVVCEIL
jgi:hypothetical protein